MNTDERYWTDYDGLQQTKHDILRKYLNGWFPKLTSGNQRVVYIDCHAGRGRHLNGQEGSPILAVKSLLSHRIFSSIVKRSTVEYFFFERNEGNFNALTKEIESIGDVNKAIKITPVCSDYEDAIIDILQTMNRFDKKRTACFAFLDPFGFDLSMDLMNKILAFPKSEIFINFMYRYINMAIMLDNQEENVNKVFGTNEWTIVRDIKDAKQREKSIIDIFSKQLDAKWVTHMTMLSETKSPKYLLIHATNHPSGRDLMKQVMWTVSPYGTFTASERNNPQQLLLLESEPDLFLLKEKLIQSFKGRSISMEDLYDWLRDELYLEKHLHQVLRICRDEDLLSFSDYIGRFAFSKNPIVKFN